MFKLGGGGGGRERAVLEMFAGGVGVAQGGTVSECHRGATMWKGIFGPVIMEHSNHSSAPSARRTSECPQNVMCYQ